MSDLTKDDQPEYRNIHLTQIVRYKLPAAGVISILHRISGVSLFLCLPFLLYLFRESLVSEVSFGAVERLVDGWFVKLILLGLAWAYLHHFCAGIRHLFMDVHFGLTKEEGRVTALTVLGVSLTLTLIVAGKIFGAY